MNETVLQMRNITKIFGTNKVLDSVNFFLRKGEVHALLGANGAGKSTLMKILNGILVSYDGDILINDKKTTMTSPHDAAKKGIAMIHQELELVDNLSIYQNIWLGQELIKSAILLDYSSMKQKTKKMLFDLGFKLDAEMIVSDLSTAQRQLVLIARAIAMNPDVIVMDEPTSSLSVSEMDSLFHVIETLKLRGISIIYISHYLEEVFRIADSVTILRNGKNIITQPIEDCTQDKIVEWMIGNKSIRNEKRKREITDEEIILDAKNLTQNKGIVHDVSFQIKKGEILGLVGVVGSGRTETAQILFGIDKKSTGTICLNGRTIQAAHNSPEKAARLKMGYIPENRKSDGLLTTRSIFDNMNIVCLDKMHKYGIIQFKPLQNTMKLLAEKLKINYVSMQQDAIDLSGGNQQKVIIGKWLSVEPSILIMDQPTRGIDVGAKEEIYNLVNELATNGMSILFISDELEEVTILADRIIVMKHGTLVSEFDNADRNIEKSALLSCMISE